VPIPPFDDNGLLPQGVFDCSLPEVALRFCWNVHRSTLWLGLESFLADHVTSLPTNPVFWIYGSFVRSKEAPSDNDLVVDVTGAADDVLRSVIGWHLNHDKIKETYHVDMWPRHPRIPRDLTAFFQYAGDKCAAELHIDPKWPKGILRVQP
jgi:hypothetical protein